MTKEHEKVVGMRVTRGNTLLELMVAMVVLTIATLGILMTYLQITALNVATEREFAVQNALREKLAEIHAASLQPYTDPVSGQLFTGIDALIAYYQANPTIPTNSFGELTVSGSNVVLYLDESTVPTALGGAASESGYGALDLDGDGKTTSTLSAWTSGVYGANMVPVEVNATVTLQDGDSLTFRRYAMFARK